MPYVIFETLDGLRSTQRIVAPDGQMPIVVLRHVPVNGDKKDPNTRRYRFEGNYHDYMRVYKEQA